MRSKYDKAVRQVGWLASYSLLCVVVGEKLAVLGVRLGYGILLQERSDKRSSTDRQHNGNTIVKFGSSCKTAATAPY